MAVRVKYTHGMGTITETREQAVGYVAGVEDGQLELYRKNKNGDSTESFMVWAQGAWLTAELVEDK
jgi:hypothetical protein